MISLEKPLYLQLIIKTKIQILKKEVLMKQLYEAPEVQVLEMELQGMIAGSGDFEIPGIPGENYKG